MRQRLGIFACCLVLILTAVHFGCAETAVNGTGDGSGNDSGSNGGAGGGGSNNPGEIPAEPVVFTPVGTSAIDDNLINMAFLPGQNGDSIVITQDGNVYYLDGNFNQIGSPFSLPITYAFDERGLLNVVPDPLYDGSSNNFVYFYYTVQGSSPDINRVSRFDVNVNKVAGTFSLSNERRIIQFQKTTGAGNHNGGSMAFMTQDELAIGVGEGAVSSLAQDPSSPLGKIHRIIPDRTGAGDVSSDHFTVPAGQPFSGQLASVFSLGVRNPFTIVVDEGGDLFFGDVGANSFEELDCAYVVDAPENYGWPTCEGACNPHNGNFRDPTHGFSHSDSTFDNEDPAPNPTSGEAIMMNTFYQGSQYGGAFTDKYIYSEFYHGWVRALSLNAAEQPETDVNIGHLEGLISLHENPADGMLYGVSLFGSDAVQRDHVLRMDLAN